MTPGPTCSAAPPAALRRRHGAQILSPSAQFKCRARHPGRKLGPAASARNNPDSFAMEESSSAAWSRILPAAPGFTESFAERPPQTAWANSRRSKRKGGFANSLLAERLPGPGVATICDGPPPKDIANARCRSRASANSRWLEEIRRARFATGDTEKPAPAAPGHGRDLHAASSHPTLPLPSRATATDTSRPPRKKGLLSSSPRRPGRRASGRADFARNLSFAAGGTRRERAARHTESVPNSPPPFKGLRLPDRRPLRRDHALPGRKPKPRPPPSGRWRPHLWLAGKFEGPRQFDSNIFMELRCAAHV